ncbi:MAG TPA: alpha-1,4-glucan--maltose-1-phosphate maltosyltransferase [Candidatus Limnocylindrales bacterium]|jgi:starch synthase (maltosyl-transferring)
MNRISERVEGRRRAVIEGVSPAVDDGRFPIKRTVGDRVVVEADAFVDGHDVVSVNLMHRRGGAKGWTEVPMLPLGNDRWRADFTVTHLGRHVYTVVAWADRFATWRRDFAKRIEAGQDVAVDLLLGAEIVAAAAARSADADRATLETWAIELRGDASRKARSELALDPDLEALMTRHPDRRFATTYDRELEIVVDPAAARFAAWYELFPRSTSPQPGRHGTFRDVINRLPYVAGMGFDILYLPPIHPIGRTFRKGANNVTTSTPDDPGVPWAIGGPEGGHTAIHPDLGTLDDFRALVEAAGRQNIAIALDIAFQSSPDNPFVRDHPDWFRHRPDGTVQYAENPPKKYQDIYPFDFESEDWRSLWSALADVIRYWIAQGVRIFRVDNPHTKPFAFWQWLIDEIKRDEPEILFLAEAFTRPRVMYRLAKVGFSQSYTYFTWRTSKAELTDYFTELTRSNLREFFRANVWPNTPDILHETLQHGGRAAFQFRFVLAATLSATYGIYGPAYELLEHEPLEPGSEEYLHSEKYEIRNWDLDRPDSLAPFIGQVNRIRREHLALQSNENLSFHMIDDDRLIAYSKRTADNSDIILIVVNLDPRGAHGGMVELPLADFGIDASGKFESVDLLNGTVQLWQGPRNRVDLDPAVGPAAILQIRPRLRSESQFESYL